MKKANIFAVFGIIGILVAAFLIWALVFNDGGIIKTGYNAGAGTVNDTWQKVTGGSSKVVPLWDDAGVTDSKSLKGQNSGF